MSSMRQLASGLLYALVSVVLVVGGLSLAMAEGGLRSPAVAGSPAPVGSPASAQPPSAVPPSPQPPTQQPSATVPAATATVPLPSSTPAVMSPTPHVILVTATATRAAPAAATSTPRPTSTRAYATAVACGPYSGWLRSYTVSQGDTLFHISTQYRTTVQALQVANCLTSTFIFPGERLWVPNVPTITPGVTIVPTFSTATSVPTEPLTLTPIPNFTETVPSDTPTAGVDP